MIPRSERWIKVRKMTVSRVRLLGFLVGVLLTLRLEQGAIAQPTQCSEARITWPEDQCTLPCPVPAGEFSCEVRSTAQVQVSGIEYCCVCVEQQLGKSEPRMCPGSAYPAPMGTEGPKNNTFTISATNGDATVDVSAGQTVYVKLREDVSWLPFTYLYLTVDSVNIGVPTSAVGSPSQPIQGTGGGGGSGGGNETSGGSVVSTPATTVAAVPTARVEETTTPTPIQSQNVNNSSNSSRRLLAMPSDGGIIADAERLVDSRRRELHLSRKTSDEQMSALVADTAIQLTEFHMKGDKQYGSSAPSAEGISAQIQASNRRDASSSYVDWYVLDGGYPVVNDDKPYYLYHVSQNKSVYIIEPVNSIPYYVLLHANGANFRVLLRAEQKGALELIDKERTTISIDANTKQFTYYRPPDEGISILKVYIDGPDDATIRIWVGSNALATARLWQKWLEATVADMNALTDNFYTSIQMETNRQPPMNYATWTLESSMPAKWSLEARTVRPRPLRKDTKIHFTVDEDLLIGLLVLDITPQPLGRLFFQVMPGVNQAAYQGWEDLQNAVKLRAVTRVNGELTYYQLSDWGYTTDGTAALQVMVSQWDADENVYLHIYLRKGAPSNSFTVVCYHIGDGFEAWKWWFGGIIFALFIFCIARCILCRRRPGVIFFRTRSYRARNLNLDDGDRHMGRPTTPPLEEVTTTEPIPEKLKKVADTLYRRLNREGSEADSSPEASPVEEVNEDGEDEGPDNSCIVCLDRDRDAILLECGHGGLCVQCADSLWNLGVGQRNCPMCRKTFTGVMRILKEDGPEVTVEPVHYAMAKTRPEKGRLTGMREALFWRLRGRAGASTGQLPTEQANGTVEVNETVVVPMPQSRSAPSIPVVATQNSGGSLDADRGRSGSNRTPRGPPSPR